MSTITLWIVSPDAGLAARWERLLRQEGWAAAAVPEAADFVLAASRGGAGLALVDWAGLGRPQAKAISAVKSKAHGVSLILTSGARLADDQIIEMLNAGADDYFPQDIDPALLLAKIKSHLRRLLSSLAQAQTIIKAPGGDLKLDRASRELWSRTEGKWTKHNDLTPTEFSLLALFLQRPGVALERAFLLEALARGEGDKVWPGTVDKHIESLRRKLGRLGARIKSIYGVGYAYRDNG